MRNFLIALATVGMVNARDLSGQGSAASVRGVWRAVQVTMTGPNAQIIPIPATSPNLTLVTAKHYSRLRLDTERPRPVPADLAKASADELRAVWGPFTGEAGTYEIGDNTITMRPIVAKNPAAMTAGAFTVYSVKIQGDTLWVTEQRTHRGPVAYPTTVKTVRVE